MMLNTTTNNNHHTQKLITAELSHRHVEINATQPTAKFSVTVYNDSDRFASFQIKLLAAGIDEQSTRSWYRFIPAVSAKVPSGGQTLFQVEIFDLPPISPQFQGVIDLTLEVTSWELGKDAYDRQPLKLTVRDRQTPPPQIHLTVSSLQIAPQQTIDITAQVQNPTATALDATISLIGLPDRWFAMGTTQKLNLATKEIQKVTFTCQIPEFSAAPCDIYEFSLEATGHFPVIAVKGSLEILSIGQIAFNCTPLEQTIPEMFGRWLNAPQGSATFDLQIDNQSNVLSTANIAVWDLQNEKQRWWQRLPQVLQRSQPPGPVVADGSNDEEQIEADHPPENVSLGLIPDQLPLGQMTTIPLTISHNLPWFGWARQRKYEVELTTDNDVEIQSGLQELRILLFPLIPQWLQLIGALLALGMGWTLWSLMGSPGHRGPVNAVQFSGQGTEVLSASDDQTLRRWSVTGNHLKQIRQMSDFQKALRVARYRPVSNDQVAIGLENGELQLINLLKGTHQSLVSDKDDRVFDVAFSRDARTLYSAHGSGLVLQWNLDDSSTAQILPQNAYDSKFAIEAMSLLGHDQYLAIGGRYNQLSVLKLQETEDTQAADSAKAPLGNRIKSQPPAQKQSATPFVDLDYPSGSQTDYISSLASADQKPDLLAVGDTQGNISLWNLAACLEQKCAALELPWLGHGGRAVRAIALSNDACFLASGGDDGQVKLWPLDSSGFRRGNDRDGRVLSRTTKPINSVDIIQTRDALWIASGSDNGRVQLHRVNLSGGNVIHSCPTLQKQ
jgi:WD40 repeat protein